MSADIKAVGDDKFAVTGELSFLSVPKLQKIGYHFITESAKPVFDLKQVTVEDNSGLALLVEWARFAKKEQGKTICFINLPGQLLDIAKLSGLEHILPIK